MRTWPHAATLAGYPCTATERKQPQRRRAAHVHAPIGPARQLLKRRRIVEAEQRRRTLRRKGSSLPPPLSFSSASLLPSLTSSFSLSSRSLLPFSSFPPLTVLPPPPHFLYLLFLSTIPVPASSSSLPSSYMPPPPHSCLLLLPAADAGKQCGADTSSTTSVVRVRVARRARARALPVFSIFLFSGNGITAEGVGGWSSTVKTLRRFTTTNVGLPNVLVFALIFGDYITTYLRAHKSHPHSRARRKNVHQPN